MYLPLPPSSTDALNRIRSSIPTANTSMLCGSVINFIFSPNLLLHAATLFSFSFPQNPLALSPRGSFGTAAGLGGIADSFASALFISSNLNRSFLSFPETLSFTTNQTSNLFPFFSAYSPRFNILLSLSEDSIPYIPSSQ